MKRFVWSLVLLTTFAVALLAAYALLPQHRTSEAALGPTVSVDLDTTGNTNTSIGTMESSRCVSVPSAGTKIPVDIVVEGVTDLASYTFGPPTGLLYNKSVVDIQAKSDISHNMFLGSAGGDVLAVADSTDPFPDDDGNLVFGAAIIGADSDNSPDGQGVLMRVNLRAKASGTTTLAIQNLQLIGPGVPPPAPMPLDARNNATLQVAVGEPCGPAPSPTSSPTPSPTPPPTPTSTSSPTPTPTATATPTPSPSPTSTPSAGSVPLVGGWNDSCYQGQARPISDAFAPVITDVQAVYRMKPDQTFDRWFPARVDVSTITSLNPFDQLFILATNDATWTVQPVAQPPSSATLSNGWNSICYLGTGKDTVTATAGISGGFSIMYNLSPGQAWLSYAPGRPELSSLARLEPFTSVLVLVTDPDGALWTFDPSDQEIATRGIRAGTQKARGRRQPCR
jgi:hypothetical protein